MLQDSKEEVNESHWKDRDTLEGNLLAFTVTFTQKVFGKS